MEMLGYEFNNLSIYYHYKKREELKEIKSIDQKEGHFSQSTNIEIIFLKKGIWKLSYNGKSFDAFDGCIFCADVGTGFGVKPNDNYDNEIFIIKFSPKLFIDQGKKELYDFLKSGNVLFTPSNYSNTTLPSIFRDLKTYLSEGRTFSFMETAVAHILCELNRVKNSNTENLVSKAPQISIMNFIKKNYQSEITMNTLTNEFNISESTINSVLKLMTGKSYKQYLNEIRLKNAKTLLAQGKDANDVYKLCGFKDYSVFYKAYTKRFGKSPKQDKVKHEYWPLS